MSKLSMIHPDLREIAKQAMAEGMTVYAMSKERANLLGYREGLRFFHYSQKVGDRLCYGTAGINAFGEGYVHMPITPSKENGSSVVVAEYLSMPALKYGARPQNGHVWDKFRKHGEFKNAKPWGIPEIYEEVDSGELFGSYSVTIAENVRVYSEWREVSLPDEVFEKLLAMNADDAGYGEEAAALVRPLPGRRGGCPMRVSYVSWAPRGDTAVVVEQANRICAEYQRQGYDLTLRQLYYQFVSRGLIPNNQKSYKRLGEIVNNARMAGLLDWRYIVDRTRALSALPHWDSPDEIIRGAANGYTIDKRAGQEIHVEVWVEKEALAGVIQRSAWDLDLGSFSCRGYVSQSEQRAAAKRFSARIVAGQKVVLVHLGDHDPSGIDMTRDIEHRISRFLTVDLGAVSADDPLDPDYDQELLRVWGGVEVESWRPDGFELFPDEPLFQVRRIALNWDQVQEYQPPPNPAKLTDSRVNGYLREYGSESWELDALEPSVLDQLIRAEVARWTDQGKFDELLAREESERAVLQEIADNYDELMWPGRRG